MTSLTACIQKVGAKLDPADKAAVLSRSRELRMLAKERGEALGATEAAQQAVKDVIGEIRATLKASEPTAIAVNPQRKHPKTVMGSELLAIVSDRLGGLDPSLISEYSVYVPTGKLDKKTKAPLMAWRNPMVPGVGLLFRRGGRQDRQEIAQALEDADYLEHGTVAADYKEAGERAKDLIKAALDRNIPKTLSEQQAEREADLEAERQVYYDALDEESAVEADAERAAIMAEAGMGRVEMAAEDDEDLFNMTGGQTGAEAMRAMGFSEQEIQDELAREAAAQAETAQAGAVQDAQVAPGAAPAAGPAGVDAAQPGPEQAAEGLTLEAPTPAGLKAKAAREKAAADADAKEQKRLKQKAKADAEAPEFTLTGSDRPADVGAAAGQGDIFDQPAAPAAPAAPPRFAGNKVFTQSDVDAARALLKKKLGQLNSGIDPELMQAGITIAGAYIESGVRKFADFARVMVDDLGERVKPYLQSWYMALRMDPRSAAFRDEMDKASAVEDLDVDAVLAAPKAEAAPDPAAPPEPAATASMPAVTGISMALAEQAHRGTSFTPERRAEQERDSFMGALREAWEHAARAAGQDPAAIERITEVFKDVADGYRERYTATLQARSRVMSSMIAGPARFPVERNRKRLETEQKRAEEASQYLQRGIKRLLRAARGPIDNSPESELERVRLNLTQREEAQDQMKAANAALRKGDDAALEDLGFTAEQIAGLKKPDFAGRAGFPDYKLTNNNAEIRRLRERLQSAEARVAEAAAGPVETERQGVRMVEDAADDRLRLIFDGKPDEDVRNDLKANGFKWSPKNEAWQRQLTDNARAAARRVMDKHYPTAEGLPALSQTPDTAERNALQALSENDDLFSLPRSDKTTVQGIAADLDPSIKVRETVINSQETMYRLMMPQGGPAFITVRKPNPYGPSVYGYENDDAEAAPITERPGDKPESVDPTAEDVWIDVSRLKPGTGGTKVYAIAANLAHNTGRIFIGDPAGLSDEAMRRRPEQMLSSALKFGTTAHLAPHPRQIEGSKDLGIPALKWVYGDDLGNIRRLIDLNLKASENAGLDDASVSFDLAAGVHRGPDRKPLSRAGIDALAASTGVGERALGGGATIARNAVLRAVLREEGGAGAAGGRRDGVLARLAGVGNDAPEALARAFYSRTEGVAPDAPRGVPLSTLKPHIDGITAKMPGLRNAVEVVATVTDLPKGIVDSLRSMNALGTVRGLRMPDGRVFLVADKLDSQLEAEFVLFHEVFGHEGLRAILTGEEYARAMTLVRLSNKAVAAEAAQWMDAYGDDQIDARIQAGMTPEAARREVRLLAVEEALADRAGKNEAPAVWKNVMAILQKALRRLGMDDLANWLENRTEAETYDLLMRARKAITDPKKVHAFTPTTSPLFQRVWHGTPHEFEKFDTSAIGSGEGAQAYGYGLYFASRREIAEHYRRTLSAQTGTVDGRPIDSTNPLHIAAGTLAEHKGDREAAAGDLRNSLTMLHLFPDGAGPIYTEAVRLLESGARIPPFKPAGGRLLEVEIPEDGEMLLWDKPLSEQQEKVKLALEAAADTIYWDAVAQYARIPRAEFDALPQAQRDAAMDRFEDAATRGGLGAPKYPPVTRSGMSGEDLYRELTQFQKGTPLSKPDGIGIVQYNREADKRASNALLAVGIKGIKYLDGVSRNKPLRDVKREFLAELPEDAGFDEVMDLIGSGTFSPKNEAVLRALADNDWLGFDYPAQAISTALSNQLANFDPSPELLQAVDATQDDSTYNYVIFSGDDVAIRQTLLSQRPPPLAPAITVISDENGNPTFRGADIKLDYPQPAERFEFIPEPGQRLLNYAIMPTEGFDALGFVELVVENGQVTALLDIEISGAGRRAGVGSKVIETILAANPSADVNISNIVHQARGFWAKMGIPEQNLEDGAAYDGTLNWQTYAQATNDGRAAPVGQGLQGQARRDDAGAAQGDRGSGRGAQGQDLPALSQKPAREPGWAMPDGGRFDNFVYRFQDKNVDLKRAIGAIKQESGEIADNIDAYLQEELFHGRAAKRTADFVKNELEPLLKEMVLRGIKQDELDHYLHARHAEEANKLIAERNKLPDEGQMGIDGKVIVSPLQDGGSGMLTADARKYLAELDPNQKRRLEALAARVDAILERTRQLHVAYGLVSQQEVDGWASMFKHYVPLFREDKDTGMGGLGTGQGFSIKGPETKSRTGSTAKVVDILANIALAREKAIVRGEKNRVAVAVAGLAKANPNEDIWTFGPVTERRYNKATDSVEVQIKGNWKNANNVLVAKVRDSKGNIQEVGVVFNERDERAVRMATALKNLDAAHLEDWLATAAKITRYFSAINTQYNPIFGFVNLVRDVQSAAINLTSTPIAGRRAELLKNIPAALRAVYRIERGKTPSNQPMADLWDDLQREGGMTGFRDLYRTSDERAEAIRFAMNPTAWMDGTMGKFFTLGGTLKVPLAVAQKGATKVFQWLSDYNQAMEGATRLAAYKVALEQGMTKQRAASVAKNVTVNFNRKGQMGAQAGALYAFFNASVQGTARMGEVMFENKDGQGPKITSAGLKILGGGVLLGSLQALALAAAGFDDDEPPQFVREKNLIIPTGWLTGKKDYITIPMPLGWHVFPNLGRIATEFAMGGFKEPGKRAWQTMGVFAESFNPVGSAGVSLQTLSPTVFDPLVALAENRDWTGKPIARRTFNEATPGFKNAKDTASTPAKWIAEALNYVSGGTQHKAGAFSPTPDQIDYLIGQVTGGVGREIAKLNQTGSAMLSGEDLPPHKIPLLGRFYGNVDASSSQGNRFYENVKRMNLHEAQVRGMADDWRQSNGLGKNAKADDDPQYKAYLEQNPEAELIREANKAEREVQKLRKDKRQLLQRNAPRAEVKQKEAEITEAMRLFNEAVRSKTSPEKAPAPQGDQAQRVPQAG